MLPLMEPVVSFYFPVGLRMIKRGYNVSYAYQPQVFTKLPEEISFVITSYELINRETGYQRIHSSPEGALRAIAATIGYTAKRSTL